ncbi:MAG: PD-(D/E)XK nuclease family protein [Candidatus Eremiobacteraeota bacterium]|nr:PD-(D/E)XK nuclease family protein [Candidatus Eremiobacteraeota bacterium]
MEQLTARAAIVRALASAEWPWPAALREDDSFVDGLAVLAAACERAGVDELTLATAIADEHVERSALARLLLQLRRLARKGLGWRADTPSAAADSNVVEVATLTEAIERIRQRAIKGIAMRRSIAADFIATFVGLTSGASAGAGVGAAIARLSFTDESAAAGTTGGFADSQKGDVADMHVRVLSPASSAIAHWFAALPDDGDVWEWPLAEKPRPLVAPTMAFSASRLNGFVKCPRRWFFEYLCDALADEGSAATTYGKVFHEALEALHRVVRRPAEFSGNAILERLHADLDAAFERNRALFDSKLEFEVSRLRARAVAAHYARWLRAEANDHPTVIESVESQQRWTLGGHEFVGVIDRIDKPAGGGPIIIYDYKTGRVEEDPHAYLAALRRGDEAQLALYYTVRTMRGDDVGRLALVSLRDPRDSVWILALDMTDAQGAPVVKRDERSGVVRTACTPADIERGIHALIERANAIVAGDFDHFAPGNDPPCRNCDYALACRERPAEEERVFAR